MMDVVYKATSKTAGKSYVGATINEFDRRKQMHFSRARNGCSTIFYDAICKYGENDFTWEILFKSNDINELGVIEAKFIDELNTFHPNGYNFLTDGTYGYKVAKISVDKMIDSLAGRTLSEEHKRNISKGLYKAYAEGKR